jgi:hypothetical protein
MSKRAIEGVGAKFGDDAVEHPAIQTPKANGLEHPI